MNVETVPHYEIISLGLKALIVILLIVLIGQQRRKS